MTRPECADNPDLEAAIYDRKRRLTCNNETSRRGAGNVLDGSDPPNRSQRKGAGVSLPINEADVPTCRTCGQVIVRRTNETLWTHKRRKYCGRECSSKAWSANAANKKPCTVEGCAAPIGGRGLCYKHLLRLNRTGSTSSLMDRTVLDRFWDKVQIGDPDECWPWTGGDRHEFGYGRFHLNNTPPIRIWAHRFAYMITTAQDATGLVVMHSCDNPPCVNPSHLSLGTQADNVADAKAKGRMNLSGLELSPTRRQGKAMR